MTLIEVKGVPVVGQVEISMVRAWGLGVVCQELILAVVAMVVPVVGRLSVVGNLMVTG